MGVVTVLIDVKLTQPRLCRARQRSVTTSCPTGPTMPRRCVRAARVRVGGRERRVQFVIDGLHRLQMRQLHLNPESRDDRAGEPKALRPPVDTGVRFPRALEQHVAGRDGGSGDARRDEPSAVRSARGVRHALLAGGCSGTECRRLCGCVCALGMTADCEVSISIRDATTPILQRGILGVACDCYGPAPRRDVRREQMRMIATTTIIIRHII